MRMNRWIGMALLALVLMMGGACQVVADSHDGVPSGDDLWLEVYGQDIEEIDETNDPLEIPNRLIFNFNRALDVLIIRPVAVTYHFWVPDKVRESIGNFLRNLSTPVILANDLLQGEGKRAGVTASRFVINSTAGILGLFDVAEDMGYPRHSEDFGQTLGSYGMGEGIYVVLPLLGPSSARDGVGKVVDIFLDPVTYLAPQNVALGRTVADGVQLRSENIETLDELERDSIDFYARIRSLHRQNRENEIRNGEPASDLPAPGLTSTEPGKAQISGLY